MFRQIRLKLGLSTKEATLVILFGLAALVIQVIWPPCI